nr:diguanylate cyclase [Tumebacillus amylolyticus]
MPILRFLTNYEAFLVTSRSFFALLLLLYVRNPMMLGGFLYYIVTSLVMAFGYNRWEKRWPFWYSTVVVDLLMVSAMVYANGGLDSDLYYYYFLTMAMAAFAHRWSKVVNVSFTTAVNGLYLLTLLLAPGTISWRDLVFRAVMFFAVSTVFPMLSFIEFQRQLTAERERLASEEKDRLQREMESMNREVAEYAFDLHQMAVLDQLTKLHNHNYFHTRIVVETEKAKQHGKPVALVLFDIDNFKLVNDTYGHLVGDDVLRKIAAQMLLVSKGTYWVPCRVGGEELAVLLPESDLQAGFEAAETFRLEIEKLRVPIPTGELLNVSVSVGVSSFPESCNNHQQLIDRADQAMYAAKRSGKNRTVVYAEGMERCEVHS